MLPNVSCIVAGWSRAFTCETWNYGKVTGTHRRNYLSIARGPTKHPAQNKHDMTFARLFQPERTVRASWSTLTFQLDDKGDLLEWKIAVMLATG